MKIFVINLDKNVSRMESVHRQLSGMNLTYERSSGVYGAKLTPGEIKKNFSKLRSRLALGFTMPLGALGCALSHLAIYRRIVSEAIPYALILEDDLAIGDQFPAVLAKAEEFIRPDQPQVVVFSNYGNSAAPTDDHGGGLIKVKSFGCADAYLITREAARRVLEKNHPVIHLADAWGIFSRQCGLELYRAFPTTVSQANAEFPSDIRAATIDPRRLLGTNGTGRSGVDLIMFRLRRLFEKSISYILFLITGR